MISVFARRVVNSVLELTRATQEVAKGILIFRLKITGMMRLAS